MQYQLFLVAAWCVTLIELKNYETELQFIVSVVYY